MRPKSFAPAIALFLASAMALFSFTPKAKSAIGNGVFQFSTADVSVSNGSPNAPGQNSSHTAPLTGYVSANGVSGNGGTTYINCYDNLQGQIFSTSTQMDLQTSFQWTPSRTSPPSHVVYCTANYTGIYANGSVSTGTITFTSY